MRLIDADALMNELMKARWAYQMLDDTWAADKAMRGLRAAEQRVKDAPTIGAVPARHGKWIDKSGGIEGAWNYCSVCGERAIDLYDYCPNCGAQMDEEER